MADSELAPNSTAEPDERQGPPPRKQVLHGSVNDLEYREVDQALDAAGFRNMSEGIRTLALLFSRVPGIRDLVLEHRSKAA
jgi:hypothetical protein